MIVHLFKWKHSLLEKFEIKYIFPIKTGKIVIFRTIRKYQSISLAAARLQTSACYSAKLNSV